MSRRRRKVRRSGEAEKAGSVSPDPRPTADLVQRFAGAEHIDFRRLVEAAVRRQATESAHDISFDDVDRLARRVGRAVGGLGGRQ